MGKQWESTSLKLQPGLSSEPLLQNLNQSCTYRSAFTLTHTCAHTYTQAPTHACKYLFAQTNLVKRGLFFSIGCLEKMKTKKLLVTSHFQNEKHLCHYYLSMYRKPLTKIKYNKKSTGKNNQDLNGLIQRAYCAVNYTIYPFLKGEQTN